MDSAVCIGSINWYFLMPNYDYTEGVEASCTSFLITVALEDSGI